MNIKKNFNALYKEYLKSVIFKSLVVATLFSCTVLAIMSFAFWYNDVKQYWIGLIVFAVLELVIFSIMFYILRPTEKKFAKKLDSLGLQERVVTMYQYQNDESLMAKIQRSNAIEYINKVNKKLVKIATPVFIIILFAIAIVSGATTTAMAALASNDKIPGGSTVLGEIIDGFADKVEYEVTFDVIGEGFIDGDIFQLVYKGEDTTPVIAIPEEGWVFVGWQYTNDKEYLNAIHQMGWDEVDTDPYHIEFGVTKNLTVYAEFAELTYPKDGEPDENNRPQKDKEKDKNQKPTKPKDEKPKPNDPNGEGGEAGGKNEECNQVFDGQTFYGDKVYENAHNEAMDNMQQNGGMSEGEKEVVSEYLDTIKM